MASSSAAGSLSPSVEERGTTVRIFAGGQPYILAKGSKTVWFQNKLVDTGELLSLVADKVLPAESVKYLVEAFPGMGFEEHLPAHKAPAVVAPAGKGKNAAAAKPAGKPALPAVFLPPMLPGGAKAGGGKLAQKPVQQQHKQGQGKPVAAGEAKSGEGKSKGIEPSEAPLTAGQKEVLKRIVARGPKGKRLPSSRVTWYWETLGKRLNRSAACAKREYTAAYELWHVEQKEMRENYRKAKREAEEEARKQAILRQKKKEEEERAQAKEKVEDKKRREAAKATKLAVSIAAAQARREAAEKAKAKEAASKEQKKAQNRARKSELKKEREEAQRALEAQARRNARANTLERTRRHKAWADAAEKGAKNKAEEKAGRKGGAGAGDDTDDDNEEDKEEKGEGKVQQLATGQKRGRSSAVSFKTNARSSSMGAASNSGGEPPSKRQKKTHSSSSSSSADRDSDDSNEAEDGNDDDDGSAPGSSFRFKGLGCPPGLAQKLAAAQASKSSALMALQDYDDDE